MQCRLAREGKRFVYSGDTEDNDTLAVFAKDADLFLMEGAFLSKDKPEDAVHVSAKEAGRIGRDAGAKRLLITHVFPEYDEQDIFAGCAGVFSGCGDDRGTTYLRGLDG